MILILFLFQSTLPLLNIAFTLARTDRCLSWDLLRQEEIHLVSSLCHNGYLLLLETLPLWGARIVDA